MGLLFQNGNLLFRGGTLAMGNCDDCCPPPEGCVECAVDATVTFTAITPCTGGSLPVGGGPYDGVYDLAIDSVGTCSWRYGPLVSTGPGSISIVMSITGTSPPHLVIDANDNGFAFFRCDIPLIGRVCCDPITGGNTQVVCGDPNITGFAGAGGSVVVSLC